MLDIVQILRRNRFLVFAENARREVLQSPPHCLPGFADRPAEGLHIRCHCHSLGNADTRNRVSRAEFALRNPWFWKLADRRLDPKGLRSPYMYAGTGVTPLLNTGVTPLLNTGVTPLLNKGCGSQACLGPWTNAKLAKEVAKRQLFALAVAWNFPLFPSRASLNH